MVVSSLVFLCVVQVAVSVTSWSPVQRSSTGCVFFIECYLEMSAIRQPRFGFDSCIWMRIPAGANTFSVVRNVRTVCGAHTAAFSMGTSWLSQGWNGRGVRLTTHLHLAPRLIMSGDITPSLYVTRLRQSNLVILQHRFTLVDAKSAITHLGNWSLR